MNIGIGDRDPPEYLWHYTDGAGALGIVEHKKLWAGHLGFMNDTSEVNYAMEQSHLVAKSLLGEVSLWQRRALEQWIETLTDSPPASWAPNVFVASLSENGDLLSQWRGYANGVGGSFSLGFRTSDLLELCGDQWSLRRCIYTEREQRELIKDEILRALQVAGDVHVPAPQRIAAASKRIYAHVMALAPVCKHPAYREEQEWRLCVGPLSSDGDIPFKFRARAHNPSPYVEFPLSTLQQPPTRVLFNSGPGPQQGRAQDALGLAMRAAGFVDYRGNSSRPPYLP